MIGKIKLSKPEIIDIAFDMQPYLEEGLSLEEAYKKVLSKRYREQIHIESKREIFKKAKEIRVRSLRE